MDQYPNGPQQPYQQPPGGYPSNPGYPTTGQMPPQGYGPPSQPGYPPQGYPQMPPQPQQPVKKKGKALWIILGLVVAVVACSVIANAGKSGSTTTTTVNSTDIGSSAPTQAPAAPKTWTTTHTYTGNGDKQTETFTVGNDWKIQWNCKGISGMDAPLYVSIYNADTNSMSDWSAVSTSCKNVPTTGETAQHGGGNLYLKIISGIDWTITIQEQK